MTEISNEIEETQKLLQELSIVETEYQKILLRGEKIDETVDRVKPPFPNLPSFMASAIVLSYLYYKSDVDQLLIRLSKNSRNYGVKHKDFISFIIYRPQITRTIEFGPPSVVWDFEYPTEA